MIMLQRFERTPCGGSTIVGRADEFIFVNAHHAVTVSTSEDGTHSVVQLANGGYVRCVDDRNEIVEMIESELEK